MECIWNVIELETLNKPDIVFVIVPELLVAELFFAFRELSN